MIYVEGERVRIVHGNYLAACAESPVPGYDPVLQAPGRRIADLPVSGTVVRIYPDSPAARGLTVQVLVDRPNRVTVRCHPNQLERIDVIQRLGELAT